MQVISIPTYRRRLHHITTFWHRRAYIYWSPAVYNAYRYIRVMLYLPRAHPPEFSALFRVRSRFPPLAAPKRLRRGPSTRNPFDRRRKQFFFCVFISTVISFSRPFWACAAPGAVHVPARTAQSRQLPASELWQTCTDRIHVQYIKVI